MSKTDVAKNLNPEKETSSTLNCLEKIGIAFLIILVFVILFGGSGHFGAYIIAMWASFLWATKLTDDQLRAIGAIGIIVGVGYLIWIVPVFVKAMRARP